MTDPVLIRFWPKKWLNDPDIAPAIRYLDRFLHDFRQTTETSVVNTVNRDAYDSTIGMVFGQPGFEGSKEIDYNDSTVQVKELICKTIANETYTATDNMVINVTKGSTLILPENPCENCLIIFTKDATQMTLKGNGRKINGKSDDFIFRKERLSRQLFYFIDDDGWYMV